MKPNQVLIEGNIFTYSGDCSDDGNSSDDSQKHSKLDEGK